MDDDDHDSYICLINLLHSKSPCTIHSQWSSSKVNILLIHENQAMIGEIQLKENRDVQDLLEQLSMPEDTYVKELRRALTTHGGAEDFAYSLENDKFTWKKLVRKNMSIKFGCVNLSIVSLSEALENVIPTAVKTNLGLSTKLDVIQNQKNALEQENSILKSKLNDVVEKKKEMEIMLYSQFLRVLNEKKKKIKELMKETHAQGNEGLMQTDESDHFDSDTEIDSDEESNCPVSKSSFTNKNQDLKKKQLTPPKRPRQEINIESIPGPSGENITKKTSKTTTSTKKQAAKVRKEQKHPKESCVLGHTNQQMDHNLSESSEDAFLFVKKSKVNNDARKSAKQTTNKIEYESDSETEPFKPSIQIRSDLVKTLNVLEASKAPSDLDVDRTVSDIDVDRTPSDVGRAECASGAVGQAERIPVGEQQEDIMLNDSKNKSTDSQSIRNPMYRGLSSSTIDVLNQLI